MLTIGIINLRNLFSAGKSGRGSSKNKKVGDSPAVTKTVKKSFTIPKNKSMLELDSDDEEIGQGKPLVINKFSKFGYMYSNSVHKLVNSKSLLSSEASSLGPDLDRLIAHSGTKQTWARHSSAWALYNSFCSTFNIRSTLPIDIENARAFVTWAVAHKKLKSSTVKAYLSSLNFAHVISNCASANFNSDRCIKLELTGAGNIESLEGVCKADRLPMTYDLLCILGHRLAELSWSEYSKQVFWTAATVSFFTSCRMGELLPSHEKGFDPKTTLLWENVKFLEGKEALIFIPFCKTKGFKGKIIDIFPIQNDAKCPAAALSRLRKLALENELFDPLGPVFALRKGKNFTKNALNKGLMNLLNDFCDEHHKITGHSFRAAIPTLISCNPDIHTVSELKEWGSWESESYKAYEKNVREKRRRLFSKIVNNFYMYKSCDE